MKNKSKIMDYFLKKVTHYYLEFLYEHNNNSAEWCRWSGDLDDPRLFSSYEEAKQKVQILKKDPDILPQIINWRIIKCVEHRKIMRQ